MKTPFFINNREAGSAVKAFLGLLAVGAVCAGGFFLYAKGKPLSENPLANLTQTVQSAISDAKPQPEKAESAPPAGETETAPAAASTQDQPPAGTAAAPAVAKATPMPLRTAPAGMIFLAKRITVTRDSGLTSFPAGTLLLIKSKANGKIRGSINGVTVEVAEKETSATFQH